MTKENFILGNVVKIAVASPAGFKSFNFNCFKNFSFMFKDRFSLRKVAMIACLAVFSFSANNALAQTVEYTDPSGVTATYEYSNNGYEHAIMTGITNVPASVTKWVIPEYITFSNGTFPLGIIQAYSGVYDLPVNNTVTEIVFPRQLTSIDASMFNATTDVGGNLTMGGKFTDLRKVTFGEMMKSPSVFAQQPLDSLIFLGSDVFYQRSDGYYAYAGSLRSYSDCPSTTTIIVPCGKLDLFLAAFAYDPIVWQDPVTWTFANFKEAECLNTITVLSSDVNLGNAISQSGCGNLTTTTPNNTTARFSGTATLYALAKGGKLFVGWNDGNLDNPRVVTVASDTTFTADFADCENTGIEEARSASAGIQVFPNPTNNTLNVQSEKFVNNGTLTLFDMSGKLVLSQALNGNSAQINMSAITAGNYILRLVENGKVSAGIQIIKQ